MVKIIELNRVEQLKKFISMPDRLYRGDERYVPYMKKHLLQTLKRLVLKEKQYTALAAVENGEYLGRLLFTVAPSKQFHSDKCGYFSHFECINSLACSRLLLGRMCELLKARGAVRVEGTYFPYDQDNRRGILVQGFSEDPMILTSYNPPYYGALLEDSGFGKDFDAVSYRLDYARYDLNRVEPLVNRILERYGLIISCADFSKLNDEIEDVHEVIAAATTDVIFQQAPTKEDLFRIVNGWKSFLWADFIHICRRKEDGKPVGFMMSVPDFNPVFRAMKGKTNPISLCNGAREQRRIRSVRAILQYVIPDYQNKGVNFALYHAFYLACRERKIERMEAGTIMENNALSRRNVEKASGILNKVYRIYGRNL